ncbi:hypothetical protein EOE67_05090 [Rheinheimera riviphila]|uniref:Uncharacterized protein n=1 Tax=Rheinheimera riviphila TaxID=1834037 RepID=A0A437R105_9GAMM|nr:hypothetical protein [Rheinheimera riviphila]RVU40428.1 hypothetical protein EOE67_05090 [Rheinheimera riviphila]
MASFSQVLVSAIIFKGSFAILNLMLMMWCRDPKRQSQEETTQNQHRCHLIVMEDAAVSAFIYIILVADGNVFLPNKQRRACSCRWALSCWQWMADFRCKSAAKPPQCFV